MRSSILLCIVFLATTFGTAGAHDPEPPPPGSDGEVGYWPGPGISGPWYNPQRSGEGFVLGYMPNGSLLVNWFTFPAPGESGTQDWIVGEGGYVVGNRVRFDHMYRAFGGVWGEAFDPTAIDRVEWGTLEFEFHDCNTATFRYDGPATHGSGEYSMIKLAAIDQIDCAGGRELAPSGGRALEGLRSLSGAWYLPSRSGEGWYLQQLSDDRLLVNWFTYDPAGNRAYVLGLGYRNGSSYEFPDMYLAQGARFGEAFDPADVLRSAWGEMTITFTDCRNATFEYQSSVPGYGSGSYQPVRLTGLASSVCIDGTPQAMTGGSWTQHASMPAPAQSELDVATANGHIYALGGFGDPRGFKRYDAATDQWTSLGQLPAGRDHLSAFAIDGGVFYTGGAFNGGGETGVSGYRYDIQSGLWEARPDLPFNYGSRAAVLNGRVFIGSEDGGLWEYDPRQRTSRFIPPPPNSAQRDHAQVQAFLGEIWVIGGRFPETNRVAIYDPVAESWRAGPLTNRFRGGFGATVVGNQLVIGGGEVVTGTRRLEPSVEIYAAGSTSWTLASNLPVPVHGTAAATVGNRVYFVSGSTAAGSACCATGQLFSIEFTP
ncbi:Kelch repeat-containing protein [Dokdonella sp.]|uniref:Kelch repeat-containing protein n=1 Tax=Dokdonella sp. TaxID=2291710 RepID=UPI00352730EE